MTAEEGRPDAGAGESAESTGGPHALAIGYYIGALVVTFGVILLLTGLFSAPTPSEERLGFDLSAWWGGVMAAFGVVVIGLNFVTRRRRARAENV